MAQDVKLIANVGVWKGGSGNGVIYAGKTEGNTYMFVSKILSNNVETWRYLRKSRVDSGFQTGEIAIAGDLNWSKFTDATAPEFVTASADPFQVITTVTNAATLPRLSNLEPTYTLKGDGIVTADLDALKLAGVGSNTTATDGTTTTTTTTSTSSFIPTDFGMLLSNPVKFFQDNYQFVIAVLVVIYLIRKSQKAKKPLWLF